VRIHQLEEEVVSRIAIGVDEEYPYSKVIKAGGFIHIKSHVGIDPATEEIPDDIREQTRLTLEHLEHALDSAGGQIENLAKINVYLSNIDRDFDDMHEAYLEFFADRGLVEQPARTTVGVPLSWPELRVQMDALAVE
jgi:2-iminobutanoate/2-iminopropanoate deaminase